MISFNPYEKHEKKATSVGQMRKQLKEVICCDAELLFIFCLNPGIASSRGVATCEVPRIPLGRCTRPCTEQVPHSLHLCWGIVGLPLGAGGSPLPALRKPEGFCASSGPILCPCESTWVHLNPTVGLGLSLASGSDPACPPFAGTPSVV